LKQTLPSANGIGISEEMGGHARGDGRKGFEKTHSIWVSM
jgi:hypothetical protein